MMRYLLPVLLFLSALLASGADSAVAPKAAAPEAAKKTKLVYMIPVREQIDEPVLYIIRRGLKEAIAATADVVVLDMKTPGGSLATTFEIMEALAKFEGETITYVNTEAISAGAFISASTNEIWFAPGGVIGAAAPVMSGGKDIDGDMKQKVVSYLKVRVRSISEGKAYRGQVVSAMIDANFEFKIGDKVIKPKGELLSLTGSEACEKYGDPAQPLLGSGIAKDLDALLKQKYGENGYSLRKLEATWSEKLAVVLNGISPILMGLGILALFIEFKTPGFGVFGITGIVLLAIVFLGNYVAGLSGYEPVLFFVLGLTLVFVELLFFPGVAVFAVVGLILMFGSLVWSMADIWPHEPLTLNAALLLGPLTNVALGSALALVLGLIAARYLPKGWVLDRMVVSSTVSEAAQVAGGAPSVAGGIAGLIGKQGIAATALRPSGQVEIEGRRYEARVEVGDVQPGDPITVVGKSDFSLIVERTA